MAKTHFIKILESLKIFSECESTDTRAAEGLLVSLQFFSFLIYLGWGPILVEINDAQAKEEFVFV